MHETIAYLNNLLQDNDTIVIGLSGGPDSMCLLNIILSLNRKINIICAHINHGLRKESLKEQEFITDYCQDKNLILETTTFSKKSNEEDYNEQELREKRYDYFAEVIKKYNAKYLFTAHHGDDLIETILMRISRGSNLQGYSGFQVKSKKRELTVIKPLIYMTKSEIEKYNKENKIPYVIDQTNLEDEHTRNRYRHNILPFLKEENKDIHLKYIKYSNELNKYVTYVEKQVKKEIDTRYQNKTLNLKEFNQLDNLIQTKIIEYILDDNYYHNLYLVSDKHVNMLLDIISNPKPNLQANLPDNLQVIKSYDKLLFTKEDMTIKKYKVELQEDNLLPNNRHITKIKDTDKNTNYYIKLNSKELSLPLYIRTREPGDKMIIKNMTSPKKLKDIFIDSKLSKEERDTQPILVDSANNILWLPGLKKSKFDKSKNEMYDIILWYN